MATYRIMFRDHSPLEIEADDHQMDTENNAVFKTKGNPVAYVPMHNVLAVLTVQTTSEGIGAIV
jgi:hypothetical protein